MQQVAHFYFHQSLNDFLRRAQKYAWIVYQFNNTPAVKDAIEAQGIPHTEVDRILVNNQPVNFFHPLHHLDNVEVFPVDILPTSNSLQKIPGQKKFVLDVHLGALARLLRLLGFDAIYQNDYDDQRIAQIAKEESRIVLTRDINLLKQKIIESGYWLRSQMPDEQVVEVIRRYKMIDEMRPFTRCIACNGAIEQANKETIKNEISADALKYYHAFFKCSNCQRVYWKGSHYGKMEATIERIKGKLKS